MNMCIRLLKRLTAVTLSATVVATVMPVPVFAEINERQEVRAENEVKEEKFDENIVVDDSDGALWVEAVGEDGEAKVETKDIVNSSTEMDSVALALSSEQEGETKVEVSGNVEGGETALGLRAISGVNEVEVTGDVTTEGAIGVYTGADDDGVNTATIGGNVSGKYLGIFSFIGDTMDDSGMNIINVCGDVTGGETGVYSTLSDNGVGSVIVLGDITSTGTEDYIGESIGIDSDVVDGKSSIMAAGDVKGRDYGILLESGDNGDNRVLVEGTVTGGKSGIAVVKDSNIQTITVTAWKIEKDADGHVAVIVDYSDVENPVYSDASEFEKKIQYIIKVEQPRAGATLTATRADGSALATVTGVAAEPWQWAYEGDKVLLKIDVDSDYTVDAVYGDKGQEYKLVKDGCGNYYIEVPRGGGVYFSAVLSRRSNGEEADNSNPDQKNEWQPPVSEATQAAINAINGTPAGGTASISWTEDKLDASSVNALLARRDITVTLVCLVNGKLVVITIPAGADLSSLVEADGTIQIEKLAAAYGTTDVG